MHQCGARMQQEGALCLQGVSGCGTTINVTLALFLWGIFSPEKWSFKWVGCLETIHTNGMSLRVCFRAAAKRRFSQKMFPVHLLSYWRPLTASYWKVHWGLLDSTQLCKDSFHFTCEPGWEQVRVFLGRFTANVPLKETNSAGFSVISLKSCHCDLCWASLHFPRGVQLPHCTARAEGLS